METEVEITMTETNSSSQLPDPGIVNVTQPGLSYVKPQTDFKSASPHPKISRPAPSELGSATVVSSPKKPKLSSQKLDLNLERTEGIESDSEPSSKIYFRLHDALNDCEKHSYLFSYEVAPGGKRKFLTTSSIEKFWEKYCRQKSKKYYEIIRPHSPSKLYYDLEFYTQFNTQKCGPELVRIIIEETIENLYTVFKHKADLEDVIVLEATTNLKFSAHVIFKNSCFINNSAVGKFVRIIKNTLEKKYPGLFDVFNNKGEKKPFIDLGVFGKNQNFRLYQSEKFGKSNPLLLSQTMTPTNTWKCETLEDKKNIFKASLICYIEESTNQKVFLQSPTVEVDSSSSPSFLAISSTASSSYQTVYHEIEALLLQKLKTGGYIRKVIYSAGKSSTFIFSIGGSRFCQNVQREHSRSRNTGDPHSKLTVLNGILCFIGILD